jgi:hypothetical protein
MTFGNGAGGTSTNTLYFAAGINGENDGLFASISLANPADHKGAGDPPRRRPPDANRAVDQLFALAGRLSKHQANGDGDERGEP